MMYPYAEFLLDFEKKHGDFTHKNSPTNSRAALIVESRPHFFLPRVLRNVMYFLGPSWNLYVFCGERNERYVESVIEGWDIHVVKLTGLYQLAAEHYNQMLTNRQFWEFLPEEKVLIFQTDSLLCGSNIDEFMSYDLVGAPCRTADENYTANGGLCLRTRSKVLECLARVPYQGGPEDVYLTDAMRTIGAKVPDLATACRFAVESYYTTFPVGVHGTDKNYHSAEEAIKIVQQIRY